MTSDRKLYVVSSNEPIREDEEKPREPDNPRARRRRGLIFAYGLIAALFVLVFLWIGYRLIDQSRSRAESLAQSQAAILAELASVDPKSTLSAVEQVRRMATEQRAIDEALGRPPGSAAAAAEEVRDLLDERTRIEEAMRSVDVSGDTLGTQVEDLVHRFNAITGPEAPGVEDLAELIDERDRLRTELGNEREKRESLETRLREMRSDLSSAQRQIDDLKRALGADAGLVEQIESLELTEASLRKLLGETRGQADRYKREADEASRQVDDWERRYTKQADELSSVRATIKDKNTTIGDLERDRRDIELELERYRAESSSIERIDDKHFVIYFGFNNADITPTVRDGLAAVVAAAGQPGISRIRLLGYTDRRGDDAYNRALAERRIASVEGPLRRQLDSSRLTEIAVDTDPRGESGVPVRTGDGIEEERNRRVEIVLE